MTAYQDALSTQAFSRRDHGYFTALMGSALATAEEPDEAARRGLDVCTVAFDTGSARTLREVERLAWQLRPWAARPDVREFRDALPV